MILDYLETHLVDHCNLNCRGCGHFSSISEKHFTSFSTFSRDFNRLKEIFDNISVIRLMGGEPLLHPDVPMFAACARTSFPKAGIWLVTNGILLPKQPEIFWETCFTNDIAVQITQYPIGLDLEGITKKAASFSVQLVISPAVSSFMQFMNPAGDSDPAVSFRNCQARFKCPFLRDGRISLCVLPATMHIFNQRYQTSIPVAEADSIDIFGHVQASDILDFLSRPSPLCRWCLADWPTFQWSVATKNIGDWTGSDGDPRLRVLP